MPKSSPPTLQSVWPLLSDITTHGKAWTPALSRSGMTTPSSVSPSSPTPHLSAPLHSTATADLTGCGWSVRVSGIFIHWGVYSVPSWSPVGQYAEWYWYHQRSLDDGGVIAAHQNGTSHLHHYNTLLETCASSLPAHHPFIHSKQRSHGETIAPTHLTGYLSPTPCFPSLAVSYVWPWLKVPGLCSHVQGRVV